MATNLLELGLSKAERDLVERGAALYKATFLEAFDNVFEIARAIDVLQKRNWGAGVQGSFSQALMQFGFTSRDGMKPIDPSIRNAYKELLENETAVRAWWETEVTDAKKNLWLSARAIHRNWKNFVNPKPKKPRKKWGRIIEGQALTEEEIRERSRVKPSPEAMEAKQAAEAEAEAERLAQDDPEAAADRRKLEFEIDDLKAQLKEALAMQAALPEGLTIPGAIRFLLDQQWDVADIDVPEIDPLALSSVAEKLRIASSNLKTQRRKQAKAKTAATKKATTKKRGRKS
jgi:hypothetical protein